MKIKKIGHCCLLIQTDTLTILTDPGAFSSGQNTITGIAVVLITHEHADHLHIDSLKEVLKNNPQAQVITNSAVAKKLDELGIAYSLLEGRNQTDIHGLTLEAFDCKHEEIFEEVGQTKQGSGRCGGRNEPPCRRATGRGDSPADGGGDRSGLVGQFAH